MSKRLPRKLTAILYADVAGYSRLTGQDEDQTHQQLSDGLNRLTETISAHGGSKVHEAGDAILAEFSSVTAAVDAAVDFQKIKWLCTIILFEVPMNAKVPEKQ
jgi:adenylate cyclase